MSTARYGWVAERLLEACAISGSFWTASSTRWAALSSADAVPAVAVSRPTRSAVASRLIGAGLAERVVIPGQRADMALDVQVTNLRAVPGAVRVMFGAFAGRNSVTATGTVQDLRGRTPVTLRSFQVESGSASHSFSGESGVADAYRRFAEDVVGALRG